MSAPKSQFVIKAKDRRGPPQCQPNPAHLSGVDVDMTNGGEGGCRASLPYPAPERLVWAVRCKRCGCRVALTAAGWPDDPRSVVLPCKTLLQ